MNNLDETKIYNARDVENAYILHELKEISDILKERGYNPIHQLVGYMLSGDLGYITSYKNARGRIMQLDRIKLLEAMVKNSLEL